MKSELVGFIFLFYFILLFHIKLLWKAVSWIVSQKVGSKEGDFHAQNK